MTWRIIYQGIMIGLLTLTAFILGFPANEIVLPIIIMGYMSSSIMVDVSDLSIIKNLLQSSLLLW